MYIHEKEFLIKIQFYKNYGIKKKIKYILLNKKRKKSYINKNMFNYYIKSTVFY